jgi:hypothetical protein
MCGLAGVVVGWLACAVCASAQTPKNPVDTRPEGQTQNCSYGATDSSGKVTNTSNCTQNNLPAAERFPFPGDAQTPDATPPVAPAQSPAGAGDGKSTAQRFPFPGESSAGKSDASSSSSSSGGDGSAGSGDPNDVNSDTPMAPKRNLHRKPAPPPPSVAQQEGEDLQVASFYMDDGNYRGAYGRAVDAVKLADDDADAHLALAEAARRLGKLDEAELNYRRALTLDPVPKTRKAAEAALKEMTGQ